MVVVEDDILDLLHLPMVKIGKYIFINRKLNRKINENFGKLGNNFSNWYFRSKSKENRPKNDIPDKTEKSVDKSAKSDDKNEKPEKMKNGNDEKYVKLALKEREKNMGICLSVIFFFLGIFWLNGIWKMVNKRQTFVFLKSRQTAETHINKIRKFLV